MVCEGCSRRSLLLGALAVDVERLGLNRWELLGLLGLPNARLLEVVDARAPLPGSLARSSPDAGVCVHDPLYPTSLS